MKQSVNNVAMAQAIFNTIRNHEPEDFEQTAIAGTVLQMLLEVHFLKVKSMTKTEFVDGALLIIRNSILLNELDETER